ncbi:MAG: cytochrome c [Pseudomonadota bacterium]|nr:cytochrome c [Pseudomonadota bacterium]
MTRILSTLFLVAGLGVTLAAQASGDAARGAEKASTVCAACHGAHGESTGPDFPKLAGQPQDYIEHALHHYKGGVRRKNPIMMGMAAALSDQDIADLAAYFSSQQGLYTKY